jgi:two-component sensor histidine kinase
VLFFRQLTLRQGLIWVVFVALFPVVVVSVVQGFSAFQNTRDLAMSRLNANAKAVAERERDAFVIAQHLLITVAANPEVITMSDGCDMALAASLKNFRPIVNIVRSDAKGLVRCSILPVALPVSLGKENWWQQGITADRMTIFKSPIIGPISRRQILVIMLPLRNREGNQYGALTAGIDVAHLRQLLASAPEARAGSVAVVTADNKIVVEGTNPLMFRPQLAGEAAGNRTGVAPDGKEYMYSFARLYGDDLFVVYAEPKKQLLAAAVSQVRFSILLPLFSILLASLAIWLGTNTLIVRWLKDLGQVATRFSRGEYLGDRKKFDSAPMEIAQLSADLHSMAEVIDKRSQDLTIALEAKDELTREVHHRVKNNLQIITSLLTLQAGRVKEPAARNMLAQTRTRISALALIHRLLYEQDTENMQGHVLIDDLMNELCSQFRHADKANPKIALRCIVPPLPVHVDLTVPLALFVVEGVNNAYRHAFVSNAGGTIIVQFEHNGDEAKLSVSDNGKGYDTTESVGEMGIELMNAFASQVEGRFEVDSAIDSGTRIILTFPLSDTSSMR